MAQSDLNKRACECLIKAGAFDGVEDRSDLLLTFEESIDSALYEKRSTVPGQISMFAEQTPKPAESPRINPKPNGNKNLNELFLKMEKEVLGLYISAHPLERLRGALKSVATAYSTDLNNPDFESVKKDGDKVIMAGIITEKTVKST